MNGSHWRVRTEKSGRNPLNVLPLPSLQTYLHYSPFVFPGVSVEVTPFLGWFISVWDLSHCSPIKDFLPPPIIPVLPISWPSSTLESFCRQQMPPWTSQCNPQPYSPLSNDYLLASFFHVYLKDIFLFCVHFLLLFIKSPIHSMYFMSTYCLSGTMLET